MRCVNNVPTLKFACNSLERCNFQEGQTYCQKISETEERMQQPAYTKKRTYMQCSIERLDSDVLKPLAWTHLPSFLFLHVPASQRLSWWREDLCHFTTNLKQTPDSYLWQNYATESSTSRSSNNIVTSTKCDLCDYALSCNLEQCLVKRESLAYRWRSGTWTTVFRPWFLRLMLSLRYQYEISVVRSLT